MVVSSQLNQPLNSQEVQEPEEASDNFVSIFALQEEDTTLKPLPRITVDILGSKVNVGIDSQSSINAIQVKAYSNMAIKPKLEPMTTPVYSFDNPNPMKTLGVFKAKVTALDRTVEAKFVVCEGVRDNLLSYWTSVGLGLLPEIRVASVSPLNQEIFDRYPKLFSGKIGKLKGHQVVLHIDKSVQPVAAKARQIPFHLIEPAIKALKKMEENDVIEYVVNEPTDWVSEPVLVPNPKPGDPDAVRVTIDGRAMNKAIKRIRHNLPTIEQLAAKVNGAKFISKLDLTGSFHQLEIAKESRYITTFRSPLGLMRYKRLVMGICCASEIFQHTLESVISGLNGVVNMIDDLFVYGSTIEEHDQNLHALLSKLESVGLTLSKEKCQFRRTELEFFGMKFSAEGIALTDARIKALRDAKKPETQSELRSFLGLASYCSRSIPNFYCTAASLYKMTRQRVKSDGEKYKTKNGRLVWTEKEIKDFEEVKKAVLDIPLAFFDRTWNTVLEVDASPVGAASVLYQVNPHNREEKHVIAYWSQGFSDIEKKYSQVEKEALALTLACEKHRIYLVGSTFTLITDNRAVMLIYGNSSSSPPARIRRFNLRLMDYDFTVVHKPGLDNAADYLSRHPVEPVAVERQTWLAEQFVHYVASTNAPRAISLDEIAHETEHDQQLRALKLAITDGNFEREGLKPFKRFRDELSYHADGYVLRGCRVIIPEILRQDVVKIAHEGHLGVEKMKRIIRDRVWFPGIDEAVEKFAKRCEACARTALSSKPTPIQLTTVAERPWERIAIDFHGPLANGHELMVLVDEHSKFPVVAEVDSTAMEHVKPKLEEIFSLMGYPSNVRSDNGPPFKSREFAEYVKTCGFVHKRITPLHPQANGQVENFNKGIKKAIQSSFVSGTAWKDELQAFLRSYRSTPHDATGVAPSRLIFIRNKPTKLPEPTTGGQPQLSKFAQVNDAKNKQAKKQFVDKRRGAREHTIKVGDKVLEDESKSKRIFSKYKSRFSGRDLTVVGGRGSMVTVRDSLGKEHARDATYFRQAPSDWSGQLEWYDESQSRGPTQAAEGHNEALEPYVVQDAPVGDFERGTLDGQEDANNQLDPIQAPALAPAQTQAQAQAQGENGVRLKSGRVSKPPERFEAGPASGRLTNRT